MGIRDENIRQHLIKPLSELFGVLHPTKENHYLEALKDCTDGQLKEIFTYLRDHHKKRNFPTIPDIHTARQTLQRRKNLDNSDKEVSTGFPWLQRRDRIEYAVKAYCDGFRTSPLYYRAASEGWGDKLMRYVRECANIQMQMIEKCQNIGWNGVVIHGPGAVFKDDYEQTHKSFWQRQIEQASTGRIEVEIPHERIIDFLPPNFNAQKRNDDLHINTTDDNKNSCTVNSRGLNAIEQKPAETIAVTNSQDVDLSPF